MDLLYFISESPRWLGIEGYRDDLLKVIQRIYKPEYVISINQELTEEIVKLQETKYSLSLQIKSLFTVYRRSIIISIFYTAYRH